MTENSELSPKIQELSILPLRNTVLFPQVVVPLAVGRPKSVKLIEDAVQSEKAIAILTQKNPETDEPGLEDMYQVGTVARILKVVKIASDNYSVIIQGAESRIRLERASRTTIRSTCAAISRCSIEEEGQDLDDVEVDALFMQPQEHRQTGGEVHPGDAERGVSQMVDGVTEPGQLCDFVAANMEVSIEEKQIDPRDLRT